MLPEFKKYNDMIQGTLARNSRDQVLKQLWTRTYAWLLTFEQLNESKHYQAIAAGCRAVLEFTVDVALVHKSDADGLAMKMRFFMDSEKLQLADRLFSYFEDRGEQVPEQFASLMQFRNDGETIRQNRKVLWRQDKHPPRWTGKSLADDVKEVDRLYGKEIVEELEMSLEQFYWTEYRRMNWHIHTGLASTWMMPAPTFSITVGVMLKWGLKLGFLLVKLVLIDFGFTSVVPNMRDRWQELELESDKVLSIKLGEI